MINKAEVNELIPKRFQALVFHFFIIFSRFEYALKRGGFITAKAEPAWDDFAKKHRKDFAPDKTAALKAACAYFEAHPPRKQTCVGASLSWSRQLKRTNEPQLVWLLCMVRRVRNNLFHGGKYPVSYNAEPSRDMTLLKHAITVLDACLALDDSVESHFRSPLTPFDLRK
jgi:hypothetical protein